MEKGPSLFTAKGIAALHQALTVVLLAMFVLGKDFLNPSVLKGCDCIVGSFLLATAQKVL